MRTRSLVAVAAFVTAILPAPSLAQNYSDIWWNPGESGWGLTLADHETQMFGVWYTYRANGAPTWFTIPGGTFSQGKRFFAGSLYQTTGPAYTVDFDPSRVTATLAGTASFDFSPPGYAPGTALFTWTVGGVTRTTPIQRQPFGSAAPNWNADATDIWWDSSESGWGLTLAQHGNNVFGVWYTYGTDGQPLFVVMPGVTYTGANTFTGTLYTTTGPGFAESPFDPARVQVTAVGSATVVLSVDNAAGGKVYRDADFYATINGIRYVKRIERQPFGLSAPSGGGGGGGGGTGTARPCHGTYNLVIPTGGLYLYNCSNATIQTGDSLTITGVDFTRDGAFAGTITLNDFPTDVTGRYYTEPAAPCSIYSHAVATGAFTGTMAGGNGSSNAVTLSTGATFTVTSFRVVGGISVNGYATGSVCAAGLGCLTGVQGTFACSLQ